MDPNTTTAPQRFQAQKEVLSPLMLAKHNQGAAGRVPNLCPFGCSDAKLDGNGYCIHLVGFTEDKKDMEPMIRQQGRRVVRVEREQIMTGETNEDGSPDFEWGDPILPPVPKGARLVRITTHYRVYVERPEGSKAPVKG